MGVPSMKLVAQAIVEFLKAQGVHYIFGKVGEGILPILDHLANENSIKFVPVDREETAVLMADGYTRVELKPGVALISGGSAVAQTVSAMGQALYDGSPVILLSSELPEIRTMTQETAGQGMNQNLLFE